MKIRFIKKAAIMLTALGLMSQAYAGPKVAEFGDRTIGNTFHNCTFTNTYSTGGGGYEYAQYRVQCPYHPAVGSSINIVVGRTHTFGYGQQSCQYYPPSGFTMNGNNNCSNWRVYKN